MCVALSNVIILINLYGDVYPLCKQEAAKKAS